MKDTYRADVDFQNLACCRPETVYHPDRLQECIVCHRDSGKPHGTCPHVLYRRPDKPLVEVPYRHPRPAVKECSLYAVRSLLCVTNSTALVSLVYTASHPGLKGVHTTSHYLAVDTLPVHVVTVCNNAWWSVCVVGWLVRGPIKHLLRARSLFHPHRVDAGRHQLQPSVFQSWPKTSPYQSATNGQYSWSTYTLYSSV